MPGEIFEVIRYPCPHGSLGDTWTAWLMREVIFSGCRQRQATRMITRMWKTNPPCHFHMVHVPPAWRRTGACWCQQQQAFTTACFYSSSAGA